MITATGKDISHEFLFAGMRHFLLSQSGPDKAGPRLLVCALLSLARRDFLTIARATPDASRMLCKSVALGAAAVESKS